MNCGQPARCRCSRSTSGRSRRRKERCILVNKKPDQRRVSGSPLAHSLTHSLAYWLLLGVGAVSGAIAQERALPGGRPGTERWIIWLKDRSFDLRQELLRIRKLATPVERTEQLTRLDAMAAPDQQECVTLLTTKGGGVERHFWILSALAAEIPPGMLAQLQLHPRVSRLVPVLRRGSGEVTAPELSVMPPPPIATSTNSNNHNVAQARTIITASVSANAAAGSGARIAFFDSGIDADAGGGQPHPSFRKPPPNNAQSRIDAHLRAGVPSARAIDCNNISANGGFGSPPFGYRPCLHSTSAYHGTGMAA